MGYIPKDARWYLADIIEEIKTEGEKRSLVHVNIVLVKSDSSENAYENALELGHQCNQTYKNTEGKKVTCRFRGLHDLNVIHGELEHGTEMIYQRRTELTQSAVKRLISKKKDLGVFTPIRPFKRPNFMPQRIADELKKRGKLTFLAPSKGESGWRRMGPGRSGRVYSRVCGAATAKGSEHVRVMRRQDPPYPIGE
jgi:Domain of unknown function (DUF4288)